MQNVQNCNLPPLDRRVKDLGSVAIFVGEHGYIAGGAWLYCCGSAVTLMGERGYMVTVAVLPATPKGSARTSLGPIESLSTKSLLRFIDHLF